MSPPRRSDWPGSLGSPVRRVAVIARTAAAVFVDGRYTVQARAQLDPGSSRHWNPAAKLSDWLGHKVAAGAGVGFDARLHTAGVEDLAPPGEGKGIKLKALRANPVDRAWGRESPAPPRAGAVTALKYAGKPADEARPSCRPLCARRGGQDAVVLTLPDSIAWLLNLRGSDVAHNPVALAFAMVPAVRQAGAVHRPAKIGAEAKAHLAPRGDDPDRLARGSTRCAAKRVRLDPGRRRGLVPCSCGGKGRSSRGPIPASCPRRQERRRDQGRARRSQARRRGRGALPGLARPRGAERRASTRSAPSRQLETMRRRDAGAEGDQLRYHLRHGANGAIVHYRVTRPPTEGLRPASCSWSTRAPSIWTAPPISRAPSPSAGRRARCRSGSRWC